MQHNSKISITERISIALSVYFLIVCGPSLQLVFHSIITSTESTLYDSVNNSNLFLGLPFTNWIFPKNYWALSCLALLSVWFSVRPLLMKHIFFRLAVAIALSLVIFDLFQGGLNDFLINLTYNLLGGCLVALIVALYLDCQKHLIFLVALTFAASLTLWFANNFFLALTPVHLNLAFSQANNFQTVTDAKINNFRWLNSFFETPDQAVEWHGTSSDVDLIKFNSADQEVRVELRLQEHCMLLQNDKALADIAKTPVIWSKVFRDPLAVNFGEGVIFIGIKRYGSKSFHPMPKSGSFEIENVNSIFDVKIPSSNQNLVFRGAGLSIVKYFTIVLTENAEFSRTISFKVGEENFPFKFFIGNDTMLNDSNGCQTIELPLSATTLVRSPLVSGSITLSFTDPSIRQLTQNASTEIITGLGSFSVQRKKLNEVFQSGSLEHFSLQSKEANLSINGLKTEVSNGVPINAQGVFQANVNDDVISISGDAMILLVDQRRHNQTRWEKMGVSWQWLFGGLLFVASLLGRKFELQKRLHSLFSS